MRKPRKYAELKRKKDHEVSQSSIKDKDIQEAP